MIILIGINKKIIYFCRHGESWSEFRSKVQQVMLQPRIASMYVSAIEESSLSFIKRSVNYFVFSFPINSVFFFFF